MFEKQHRIVAPDRRPQQSHRIERIRREYHAQARDVRKQHLAALAVINRPTGQIPANGHADDGRTGKTVV